MILKTYNKWVKDRVVPVRFRYPLDTTLFNKKAHHGILASGLSISPLALIHAASVHYSGRFKNSSRMQFINAFVEIFNSVEPFHADGHLCFNENENSEFQGRSTEAIAVGLCIRLSEKLFCVNRSRICLIDGSGKRCDFSLVIDQLEYFIESKGRKGGTASAIQDVFAKKVNYPATSPKYGFVSSVPRGIHATSMEVVDPEFTPREISRNELIRRLLVHYSKVSALAGFSHFSNLLESQANAIRNGTKIETLENRKLIGDDIQESGEFTKIHSSNDSFNFFFPNEKHSVFGEVFEGNEALFIMEKRLIEILNNQEYQALIDYNLSTADSSRSDDVNFSISSDGSALILVPSE